MDDVAFAYPAFAQALEKAWPGWSCSAEGLHGPNGELVQLTQRHSQDQVGHMDVRILLDQRWHGAELWDCVKGSGKDDETMARTAAYVFTTTTAAALREVASFGAGTHADHHHGFDRRGLSGWHCVASPGMGFGQGSDGCALLAWWSSYPWLRRLGRTLRAGLEARSGPHGVKILFGGDDVAEVRIGGERHEAASEALLAMPWPRLGVPFFVRSYVILLHPESWHEALLQKLAFWRRPRRSPAQG